MKFHLWFKTSTKVKVSQDSLECENHSGYPRRQSVHQCIFLLEESVQRFFHRDLLLSFSGPSKMPKIQRFRDRLRLSVTRILHTKRQKNRRWPKKKENKKKKIYERLCIRQFSTSSSSSSSSKKNLIRETKDIKRKQKKLGEEAQIHLSDSPSLSQCRFITVSERYQRWTNRKEKEKNLLNIHRQSSPSVPWEAHQVYL